MICSHYFRLQRRHRHALCSDGGFSSQHPRRIAARDRRDGRERRDTRNKGLRVAPVALGLPVARLSRWSPPILFPQNNRRKSISSCRMWKVCVPNRLSHWSWLIGQLSHLATSLVGSKTPLER
jgi:hypothetical protein